VPEAPERVTINEATYRRRARRGKNGWHYDAEANVLTLQFRGTDRLAYRIGMEDIGPVGSF
jgi:hypothetical protein